jgi:surface antigen
MRASVAVMAFVVLLGAQAPGEVAAATERNGQAAASRQAPAAQHRLAALSAPRSNSNSVRNARAARPAARSGGISCVPYARMVTGMNITGDARLWWQHAAGDYARGQQPEPGSVLAFQSSGGMRRGHVAVVSRLISPRQVLVDHANWEGPGIRKGTVMRGVSVVDVSDRNDWTQVRVQVGRDGDGFGRVYPTYGFIYNRPAGSRIWTAGATPATRGAPQFQEVAEADGTMVGVSAGMAPHAAQHIDLTMRQLGLAE